MKSAVPDDETLVDKILRWLKNNPVIAVIIVAAVIISSIATFWNSLPPPLTAYIESWIYPPTIKIDNGWLWAGYLDRTNIQKWSQGPFVKVIKQSGSTNRPYPIRDGDTVRMLQNRPQVIVDFKNSGSKNVLTAPPKLVGAIGDNDYTGITLKQGDDYFVNDVSVAAFSDHDYVVWLRLTPAN